MKHSIMKHLKNKAKEVWKNYGTEITYLGVMAAVICVIPDTALANDTGFESLTTGLNKGLKFVENGIGPVLLGGGVAKAAYQHFTEQQSQGYKSAIAACIGGAGCLNAETIVDGVFGKSSGCIFF